MAVLLFVLFRQLFTAQESLVHAYLAFNIAFPVLMESLAIIAHL